MTEGQGERLTRLVRTVRNVALVVGYCVAVVTDMPLGGWLAPTLRQIVKGP